MELDGTEDARRRATASVTQKNGVRADATRLGAVERGHGRLIDPTTIHQRCRSWPKKSTSSPRTCSS